MRNRFFLVLALVLQTSLGWAATPTFDVASSGTAANTSSVTASLTVSAGCANPILIAAPAWQRNPLGTVSSAVATAGTMTFLVGRTYDGSSTSRIELYYYVGATGAQSVTVTFDASKNSMTLGLRSYCNVNQASAFGTSIAANGSATPITQNVTSATGELVIDAVAATGGTGETLTVGAGQTQELNFFQDQTNHIQAASDEAGAGTVTMSWTISTNNYWASLAVPLKPSADRRPASLLWFSMTDILQLVASGLSGQTR